MRARRLFERRFVGGVDDCFPDADQRAAHPKIVQDLRVVADVGNRRCCSDEIGQIGHPAHFDQARIGLQLRMKRKRRNDHAAAFEARKHGFEQALVQRIVEMLGPEQRRNFFRRPVVHDDRAEQRLLDIDVVGDVAIDFLFHASRAGR